MELTIKLPDKCECGFENLKIWGTRTASRLQIEVRCGRCGKVLWRFDG